MAQGKTSSEKQATAQSNSVRQKRVPSDEQFMWRLASALCRRTKPPNSTTFRQPERVLRYFGHEAASQRQRQRHAAFRDTLDGRTHRRIRLRATLSGPVAPGERFAQWKRFAQRRHRDRPAHSQRRIDGLD